MINSPPFARFVASSTVFLSIVAGKTLAVLERHLGAAAIVRAMPNTPALIGLGMTGLFAPKTVSVADCTFAEQMLQAVPAALDTLFAFADKGLEGALRAARKTAQPRKKPAPEAAQAPDRAE